MNIDLYDDNDDQFFGSLQKRHTNQLDKVFCADELEYNDTQNSNPLNHPASSSSTGWNTLWAKVANSFKNSLQVGKVGVAIIKNIEQSMGKIIIYKTKNCILATATAVQKLNTIYQNSNYIQFYDDEDCYWSLHFDKHEDEKELIALLKEMGLSISNEENKQITSTIPISLNNFTCNAEINENTKFSKHTMLERMANVGLKLPTVTNQHSIGPFIPGEDSESSDTEIKTTSTLQNKPLISPRNLFNLPRPKTQIITNNAVFETQLLQMLLTENRTQNSEMRMTMNKLETKVEKVLDKLNSLRFREQDNPNKVDEILQLEEKILTLKKENRKLSQKLEQSERMNDNINNGHLLKVFEFDLKHFGITNTTDINLIIGNLLEKIKTLEKQLKESEELNIKKSKELQASIQRLNEQNMKVLQRHSELELAINTLETAMNQSKAHNRTLELQLADSKRMNVKNDALQKQETLKFIKFIMNNLHSKLSNELYNLNPMDSGQVLAIIGKTIREETFDSIDKVNKNAENISLL